MDANIQGLMEENGFETVSCVNYFITENLWSGIRLSLLYPFILLPQKPKLSCRKQIFLVVTVTTSAFFKYNANKKFVPPFLKGNLALFFMICIDIIFRS